MDGELEAKAAEEVVRHLSACEPCAARAREDREILEAIRMGAPPFPGRPIALDPEEVLLEAERARREEKTLVIALKRVTAAAALLLFASGILIGWNVSSVERRAEAGTSIRGVAIPSSARTLFDDENSVMIAITRR